MWNYKNETPSTQWVPGVIKLLLYGLDQVHAGRNTPRQMLSALFGLELPPTVRSHPGTHLVSEV